MNAVQSTALPLLPDCGGLIRTIAFALPAAFFADNGPADTVSPLIPIGNLLSALPADIAAAIVVDRACVAPAQSWLDGLPTHCPTELIPLAGNDSVSHPWLQDMLHVGRNDRDGYASAEFVLAAEKAVGVSLAEHLGAATRYSDVALAGAISSSARIFGWWAIPACRMTVASEGIRPSRRSNGERLRLSTAEACSVSGIGRRISALSRHL